MYFVMEHINITSMCVHSYDKTALHRLVRCTVTGTTLTLLGLYHVDYTDLGNICWPVLLNVNASGKYLWPLALWGSTMGPSGGLSPGCHPYPGDIVPEGKVR